MKNANKWFSFPDSIKSSEDILVSLLRGPIWPFKGTSARALANNYTQNRGKQQRSAVVFSRWDCYSSTCGLELVSFTTTLKNHTAPSTAQPSHSSPYKQGQEHGHAYTSLTAMLLLCPACHLLAHYCLSSIPLHHPRSSPPLLHCTQTQRDASCNHCWTQFQGQFEDYLLSLVNEKQEETRIFGILIW